MKMLITGDLVINQKYNARENIDDNIKKLFEGSDCNIVNLEAPVTQSTSEILKTGPHLKADKQSTLEVLKYLNIHIAALANNHIKDYDEQGILDTINFCKSNNIQTIGAGKNLEEASTTTVLDTLEGKIALINIAENEWASAGVNSAGANGMDLIKDTRKIQQAKKENDFVFVIVHGGHEYYNLPSPRMQEQYRFYAEQGADLVVGHHTHCISGYETHEGTPIYYSLGNFLFTKSSPNEEWYTGLVLDVEINDRHLSAKVKPIGQSKDGFELSLLKGSEKERVLKRIESFNKVIENKQDLFKKWSEYTKSQQLIYLNYWSPLSSIKNRYISGVLRRLKINFLNKKGASLHLNLMRCEAHHDLSKSIIKRYLYK